jgi:hypothetical protein
MVGELVSIVLLGTWRSAVLKFEIHVVYILGSRKGIVSTHSKVQLLEKSGTHYMALHNNV